MYGFCGVCLKGLFTPQGGKKTEGKRWVCMLFWGSLLCMSMDGLIGLIRLLFGVAKDVNKAKRQKERKKGRNVN